MTKIAAKANSPAIPSAAVVCRKILDISDVWFDAEVVITVEITAGDTGVTVSMATEVDDELLSIWGKRRNNEKIFLK